MFDWLKRRRDAAKQVLTDADLLMNQLGEDAYAEARQRARNAASNPPIELHWSKVRREIGRRTGRRYVDTATRYLEP